MSFTTFYNFTGSPGPYPLGKLLQQGNLLYGTTLGGGSAASGAIFTIHTNGTEHHVIESFPSTTANSSGIPTHSDGAGPMAGLVSDGGLLYGTTAEGGRGGRGTVFSLGLDGTGFAVLNNFNGTNGRTPYAGLILAGDVLYGTTRYGGIYGAGTLFSFAIPPVPALQITNLDGHPVIYWTDDGLNRTLQTAADLVSGSSTRLSTLNGTNASAKPQRIGYEINDDRNHAGAFFWLE